LIKQSTIRAGNIGEIPEQTGADREHSQAPLQLTARPMQMSSTPVGSHRTAPAEMGVFQKTGHEELVRLNRPDQGGVCLMLALRYAS
jgi:hypothetical protein